MPPIQNVYLYILERDLRQKHVNNAVLIYRHLFVIDLIVIFGWDFVAIL